MAKLINEARALESFRSSDFDIYSAYGEVVDNSVQAGAAWIKIKTETAQKPQRGRSYYQINEIAFSDNGKGMNQEVLNNCLAMGYSSRYNDRSGIGRFGVGMTLASINQCKRVEVYSREDKGDWLWTYADLDEIANGDMTDIPEAQPKVLPVKYVDIASEGPGTIVVWTKYDRQPESAETIEQEMKIWLGRTYRYFIWEGTQIFVNGDEIKAIDPLYVKTEKTKFPNDPKSEEMTPQIKFDWSTMKNDSDANDFPAESEVVIRMSLLPKEFRKERGAGNSREAKERQIERNEGVSIIRNKREVFYGTIPYYSPQFLEIDRWWGCEISFEAVLDNAFTVKNIKRGALPTPDLRQKIKEEIEEFRKKAVGQVQECWRKGLADSLGCDDGENESVKDPHSIATGVIKTTPTPTNPVSAPETPPTIIGILKPIDTGDNPITFVNTEWEGPNFFTRQYKGGQIVLAYNNRHLFFEELNAIMQKIETEFSGSVLHRDLRILMDLVLAAFSKSEAMLEGMPASDPDIFAENIRNDWGKFLKQYLTTWQKNKELLSKDSE